MRAPTKASASQETSANGSALRGAFSRSLGFEFIGPSIVVPPTDDARSSMAALGGDGDYVSTSSAVVHGERLQIEAIVSMSKEWVFIRPEQNSGYFGSFQDATSYLPAVDSLIRVAQTTKNPAWSNGQINANLVGSLFRALQYHWGKGVGGCILMDNGDVACWQINPMAPGAAVLIKDSAKDAEGKPLNVNGATAVPGSAGVRVSPSPGYVSYSFGSYQYKCGFVNGALSECGFVLTLPQ